MTLADRVLAGDPRAIARGISLVEDGEPAGIDLVRQIFRQTGRAYLVGVTGPPGAGKSTLVDRLIAEIRASGRSVGVLAIDPTSPFTGGALLGDRLRMQMHAGDSGVFVRSMATRGQLGGLARATQDAALVLDAAGREFVLIETVGVGQDEVDVVRAADVSIVTLVPGTGDDVQALKAGIMEIGDVFVVNKADRDGADRLVSAVEANLSLHAYGPEEWRPPVLKTVATSGTGVDELLRTISMFRGFASRSVVEKPFVRAGAGDTVTVARSTTLHAERRRARCEHQLRQLIAGRFLERLDRRMLATGGLSDVVDRIASRDIDPYTAADDLLRVSGVSP
jgi:LAO/AO transport system kinase